MKRLSNFVFVLLFAVFFSLPAFSQSEANEEKTKLIGEMIILMRMDQQFPQMVDGMLKEMEKSFPIGFNAAVDGNDSLTPEQKAELKAKSGERFVTFSQKFRKRLSEKIDYGKYIREAVYPLYDKFYTEQELKDLIAFYKTTTGQKLIATLPALLAESNKTATEKFVPMLIPIVQDLIKEDFGQIGTPLDN